MLLSLPSYMKKRGGSVIIGLWNGEVILRLKLSMSQAESMEARMLKEFREFIMRGNVMDLAVAVIIGAAFGAVVTSLVNDVIMPPIGAIVGGIDFSQIVIKIGAVDIRIGAFINAVINFLIVAAAVFLVVRAVNQIQALAVKKPEAAPAAPPAPTTEELMLAELKAMRAALEKEKK